MFNVKKQIYFILLIFIFFITILLVVIRIPVTNKNKKLVNINNIDNINISEFVSDRYIYETKNKIVIGNNLKQIENGFYDVSIEYNDSSVSVFFNKLYKEEYSEKLYVNKNYLYEILNLTNVKFGLNIDERKLQELVVLIADKYMEYKNDIKTKNEIIDNLNSELKYEIKFNEEFLVFNIKI